VSATISNASGGVESIAFALFAVRTASGLQIQASAATAQLAQACAADQSLAPGGTTSCSLAFEVPTSESPTTLVWLDPKTMLTSTASLPAVMQSSLVNTCEQVLAFKNFSTSSCLDCIQTCKGNSSACSQTENNCAAACAMNNPTSQGACTCIDHCATTDACRQAGIAEYQCVLDTCSAQCN